MTRVYIIGAQTGPVKIGMAGAPSLRLRDLQVGYPFELELLAELAGGEQEEAAIHELFREQRLRGEWFKRSKRLRHFIDMVNCGVGLSFIFARLDPSEKTRAGEMYRKSQDEERAARLQRSPPIDAESVKRAIQQVGMSADSVSITPNGIIRVDLRDSHDEAAR
jgi:hypothetical protein